MSVSCHSNNKKHTSEKYLEPVNEMCNFGKIIHNRTSCRQATSGYLPYLLCPISERSFQRKIYFEELLATVFAVNIPKAYFPIILLLILNPQSHEMIRLLY